MAAALLLMLVTGIFIAGWVTMMGARAIQVSWLETAVQRRLSLENSKVLSWQINMEHSFDRKSSLDAVNALLLDGKGGGISTDGGWTDINAYGEPDSYTSTTKVFPYNQTGLRPGGTYISRDQFYRPGDLAGLDAFTSYLFLKGTCPVLNNDLFVVYRKPKGVVSELDVYQTTASHNAYWQVYGRTVIRYAPSLFVLTTSKVALPFRTKSLYVQTHDAGNSYPISGLDMDGLALLPSNLPAVPSSMGPVSAKEDNKFDGYLNVIRNDDNPENSLYHFMNREKLKERTGYVTIDTSVKSTDTSGPYWMTEYSAASGNLPVYKPPGYPFGYPDRFKTLYIKLDHANQTHYRISNAVNQIVFVGQDNAKAYEAAGAMPPIMVTLIQGDGQPTGHVVFANENNRRLIFGVKDSYGQKLDVSFTGKSILGSELRWRMTLINEYQSIWLSLHENSAINTRWIGGVMTNWFFKRYSSSGSRSERLIFQSDDAVPTLPLAAGSASYASLLPRDVWHESFFLPVPPPTAP